MDEIIQIKCPFDGALLSVKNQPGIETKNVTCPICKHTYPFSQFKRVVSNAAQNEPPTEYPDPETPTEIKTGNTVYGDINLTIGTLTLPGTDITYQLKPGRNVIGRKATKSAADFQIPTGDKRSMSREHIVIEVKKVPGKGFVHCLSLYKEAVNETFVGSEPLVFGDCIVLGDGDIINLPDASLKFEIPDDERTEMTL